MPLYAKSKGESSIPPIESGTHQAVCYGVIDIGTQKVEYQGKIKNLRKCVILWEVPGERIELEREGQKINLPRGISKTYTLSLSEKSTLFAHLTNWRGFPFTEKELTGFDVFDVLGANCLLQIVNDKNKDGKKIAYVSGVMKLLKSMPKLESENAKITYSVASDGLNIPTTLPPWIKEKIELSQEIVELRGGGSVLEQVDPDLTDSGEVPF